MRIDTLNMKFGLIAYKVTIPFLDDKSRYVTGHLETAAVDPIEAVRYAIKHVLSTGVPLKNIQGDIMCKENTPDVEGS